MMSLIVWLLLWCMARNNVVCVPAFTSWPQAVSSYKGKQATLTWIVSETVSSEWAKVKLFYNQPTRLDIFTLRKKGATFYDKEYVSRSHVDIEYGSPSITLTLDNIQWQDVTFSYGCSIEYENFKPPVVDTRAWIILYDEPDTPVISSSLSNVKENQILNLYCSATSTTTTPSSLPSNLRPTMKYTWLRDNKNLPNDGRHTVSVLHGDNLTINTVHREDHGIAYTCIAQETGSKLINSKEITLNVNYKPGSAEATKARIGPFFEGFQEDITMSCTVTDPGNPPAVFEWSKDGTITGRNTTGSYIISSGQLSVSEHDGLWQCTPVNVAGRGQPATINVTVYAKSQFTHNLSNQTVRADRQSDLDVLCSVQSRPAADVTWQYEGGSLPVGVIVMSETDVINGKLTTVKRRLKWSSESTEEERRNSNGTFTCTASLLEEETTQRLYIDVQYGPRDLVIISPDKDGTIENDTLILTCTANCNPKCSYSWTKADRQTSNSDQLQFESIRREDRGTYRCTASNQIGNDQYKDVFVQVYYPPDLTITVRPSGDLVKGKEVTLMCTADSIPTPSSITWANITEPGLSVLDSSQHNDTHSWLTLSEVDILDSGTYQCTADNGVRGSPVSARKTILVNGPARWYKTEPFHLVNGVSVGDTANFKVWVIARPLPTPDQWHWKFSPNNSSSTEITDPGQVSLNVSGNMAVLNISNVNANHYGDYYIWTRNSYGGWDEGDLKFTLKAQGPPFRPYNLQVVDVTAVSIKLQWTTGFDGGLTQTFTIKYTNVASGEMLEKSGIRDAGFGSGHNMIEVIRDGIEPQTEYQLQIIAVNELGQAVGENISTITPTLAKFIQDPVIEINGEKAQIHFTISGQVTRVEIKNCVQTTQRCLTESVTISQEARTKRQTSVSTHSVSTEVTLADPEAKEFLFSFSFYDGDVLLYSVQIKRGRSGNVGLISGCVVGITLAVLVVIILILWKRGLLNKAQIYSHHQQHRADRLNGNHAADGNINSAFTYDDDIQPYNSSSQGSTQITEIEVPSEPSCQASTSKELAKETSSEQYPPQYAKVMKSQRNKVKEKHFKSEMVMECAEYENIALQNRTKETDQVVRDRNENDVPYVNVMDTAIKGDVYSEVEIRHNRIEGLLNNDAEKDRKQIKKPLQFIGEDGTVYAQLDIINKPPIDPSKIHGKENLVEYSSIDYDLLKKK